MGVTISKATTPLMGLEESKHLSTIPYELETFLQQ